MLVMLVIAVGKHNLLDCASVQNVWKKDTFYRMKSDICTCLRASFHVFNFLDYGYINCKKCLIQ